jgi:hypothetical protein
MLELEAHVIGSLSAHALVGTSGAETTQRKQGVDHRILNGDPAGPPSERVYVVRGYISMGRCEMRGCRIGYGAVALFGSDVYNRADMA